MSIKSQKGLSSDLPLYEKQRKPITRKRQKDLSPRYDRIDQVDNIRSHVEKNLEQIPKPRSKEYR